MLIEGDPCAGPNYPGLGYVILWHLGFLRFENPAPEDCTGENYPDIGEALVHTFFDGLGHVTPLVRLVQLGLASDRNKRGAHEDLNSLAFDDGVYLAHALFFTICALALTALVILCRRHLCLVANRRRNTLASATDA